MKDFRPGLTQTDLFVFGETSPCILENVGQGGWREHVGGDGLGRVQASEADGTRGGSGERQEWVQESSRRGHARPCDQLNLRKREASRMIPGLLA